MMGLEGMFCSSVPTYIPEINLAMKDRGGFLPGLRDSTLGGELSMVPMPLPALIGVKMGNSSTSLRVVKDT
ncbi:hypothetical protein M413DRAFT_328344 [Hebeloma cylindrosporum]|uniref:Uncharacterized protein n=1 Tax=Hebeloma cylindrosporum TaxID=76867 RepID=A0A0C2Y5E9_HEBCY|nr:hypothetical protein M413DRAFT_328344 [Hebeloma cylindrosporum h7]